MNRFEDLLRAWQDGDATPAGLQELEELLRADASRRRELVRSVGLEVKLYRRYSAAPAHPTAVPWRRRRLDAAAAVLILGLTVWAFAQLFSRAGSPRPAEELFLGTVVRTAREGDALEPRDGKAAAYRFADGSRVLLDAGGAGVLRGGDAGARLVFDLRRGGARLDVPPGEKPIRVSTPAGSVSAGGASFGVEVRSGAYPRHPDLTVAVSFGEALVDSRGAGGVVRAPDSRTYAVAPELVHYEKLLADAILRLEDAVTQALASAPGVAIEAGLEEEKGKVYFAVEVATGREVREIKFDVRTGEIAKPEVEDDDRSAVVAAAKVPLRTVIQAVLARYPGKVVEAEVELEGGRVEAEVMVITGGRLLQVKVDAETGQLLPEK